MEKSEDKELFKQTVIPVILGNGIRAHRLSLRFFFRYGVRSVICGKRKGLLDILDPVCDFLKLYSDDSRLMCEQLSDISEDGEFIMPLISVTDRLCSFVNENEELLESRFIICRKGDIDRHLFSSLGFDFISEG